MSALTGFQRKYLRGLAHGVQPAVQVGVRGLEPPVLHTIDQALTARELVKVQLAGERDQRHLLAETISAELAAELVGAIGHMAIFFRPHVTPGRRSIRLPRSRAEVPTEDA